MTPVERALLGLRPVIGDRMFERIRSNLPSRKPQLWDGFPRVVVRRFQRSILSRLDRHWKDRKFVVRLSHTNLFMELTPANQDIDLPVLQFGAYEISGTRFVQTLLKPGMVFVDVGANSGYYSLIASGLVAPSGHVFAIEPAHIPYLKLVRNIQINGLENVKAIQSAAGIRSGRSVLYGSVVDRNDGLGSLAPGSGRSRLGRDVRVVTLDEVVRDTPTGKADLVKIDVEGTELDVLRGGEALLSSSSPPALLFESFDVAPIVAFLTSFGYEVRRLHFSLSRGLEFPRLREAFDNSFAAYEAPNFVAVKLSASDGAFSDLAERSKRMVRPALRMLAELA